MIAKVAEDTHGTLLELGSIYAIRMICSKSETHAALTDLMARFSFFHSFFFFPPLESTANLKTRWTVHLSLIYIYGYLLRFIVQQQ